MKVSNFPKSNIQEEIPIHFIQHSEILNHIKTFFRLSKFFSVLPNIRFYQTFITSPKLLSLSSLLCVLLIINQGILIGNSLGKGHDFVKTSGPAIVLRTHVLLVYIWSLIYSGQLVGAIRASPFIEKRLKIYTEIQDVGRLRKQCLGLLCIYVLTGLGLILSSILVHLLLRGLPLSEAWENYCQVACGLNPSFLFHYSLTNIYCILSNYLTYFGWIFGDFLLTLLSFIFSNFYSRLIRGIKGMDPCRFSVYEIDLIREHFGVLSRLVNDYDNSISFLNLISCLLNVAYVILGGYSIVISNGRNVQEDPKAVVTSNIITWILVIVAAGKLVSAITSASYLYQKAQEATIHLRAWPMTRDTLEYSLNHGRIGIIQSFITQLTSTPKTGFSLGKYIKIRPKIAIMFLLGMGSFFAFTRITLSTCLSRTRFDSRVVG